MPLHKATRQQTRMAWDNYGMAGSKDNDGDNNEGMSLIAIGQGGRQRGRASGAKRLDRTKKVTLHTDQAMLCVCVFVCLSVCVVCLCVVCLIAARIDEHEAS